MIGLINTRPVWDNDEDVNLWSEDLGSELSKNIQVLNAPLQVLSLKKSENVANDLSSWLDFFSLNQLSGYMIFTSPASVKAFIKHLDFFKNAKHLKIIEDS